MNLLDLFWNNEKLTQSVQHGLLGFLKNRRVTFEAKPPVFRSEPKPFNVSSLAMLRMNSENEKVCDAPIIIGCTQPDGRKTFYDLAAPGMTAPNEQKSLEGEMIKVLFEVLKSNFKEAKIALESTAGISVPFHSIGPWESVVTSTSVQFPFSTPDGTITLEIPVFDNDYHHARTMDISGFDPKSRILLVDDAMTTRKIARHQLAQVGYRYVEECEDGAEAFKKLQAASPRYDLVIADWHMPNLTGIDLLRKIRATPKFKDLPVLLATGERKQEEILNAIKERVSGYVVKPYDCNTLYKAMKKAAPAKPAATTEPKSA